MKMKKGLALTAMSLMFLGIMSGPAAAGAPEDREKCNSGRGNGSETVPADDCDPGNSGGHNNGGD